MDINRVRRCLYILTYVYIVVTSVPTGPFEFSLVHIRPRSFCDLDNYLHPLNRLER